MGRDMPLILPTVDKLIGTAAEKIAAVFGYDASQLVRSEEFKRKNKLPKPAQFARDGTIWILYKSGFNLAEISNYFNMPITTTFCSYKRFDCDWYNHGPESQKAMEKTIKETNETLTSSLRLDLELARRRSPPKWLARYQNMPALEEKVNKVMTEVQTLQKDWRWLKLTL